MLGIRVDDVLGNIRDDHGRAGMRLSGKYLRRTWPPDGRSWILFTAGLIQRLTAYLMVSGEPLFDSSGRFTGYRGVGKDVTGHDALKIESPANK